ncbi:MAG: acyltransferase [Lachnospiraceae bacterium]|nr:acyltransferase [Lachnospiraceae bacterium]
MVVKKNQYIDLLKGISCIIVICLHCPFPGVVGDGIIYGLRFSVPVFFMISGYFSYSKSEDWIIDKARYILKLLIFTELFYCIWRFIQGCLFEGNTVHQILKENVINKNLIQVLFCGTLFNGTLWYLYAMFWTWIIIWFFRKRNLLNKMFFLVPLLLIIQIFGRYYVQNNYDINRLVILFRNAITFGLPFTMLGIWIAKNKEELLQKISVPCNLCMVLVGFLLIVVEFFVVGQYMDTHISTVIIVVGLFLYAVRQNKEVSKYLKVFIRIGSVWYVWIYLLHIFVMEVLKVLYRVLQIEDNILGQYVFPILVCIVSCIIAELIIRLINYFNSNGRK